jgi:hypothetical protein
MDMASYQRLHTSANLFGFKFLGPVCIIEVDREDFGKLLDPSGRIATRLAIDGEHGRFCFLGSFKTRLYVSPKDPCSSSRVHRTLGSKTVPEKLQRTEYPSKPV